MVYEARKQSMAWMETMTQNMSLATEDKMAAGAFGYTLGIMGEMAPLMIKTLLEK